MRHFVVYLGLLLILVGVILGTLYATDPASNNLLAQGPVAPGGNTALPFTHTAPGNASYSIQVSYQFGDSHGQVWLQACPSYAQGQICSGGAGPVLLNISGPQASGSVSGLKSGTWYVLNANEPVVATVSYTPSLVTSALEYGAVGAGVGGLVVLGLGLYMKDPLKRPTPRLAQLKRTLYFFIQSRLAVIGLALLIAFVLVAVLSPVLAPVSPPNETFNGTYDVLPVQCSYIPTPNPYAADGWSWNTPPACQGYEQCVYSPPNPAPPGNCVAVNSTEWGAIPPTISLSPLTLGPLPFGSMTAATSSQQEYYNIWQGEIRGTPWDLVIAGGVVGSGALIGLVLGALSGLKGGIGDDIIMRLTDIFLSIPGLFLVLIILAVVSSTISTSIPLRIALVIGAFVVTWWPGYTRIVRSQVLVTREQKFVEAAKASGAGTGRILRRHIIPNSIYPVFVQMSLDVGVVPLLLASIFYLGFGPLIFPSEGGLFPEWGVMAATSVNISNFYENFLVTGQAIPWWQIAIPGLVIFFFAISVNFFSDGLRDALDPRLRR